VKKSVPFSETALIAPMKAWSVRGNVGISFGSNAKGRAQRLHVCFAARSL